MLSLSTSKSTSRLCTEGEQHALNKTRTNYLRSPAPFRQVRSKQSGHNKLKKTHVQSVTVATVTRYHGNQSQVKAVRVRTEPCVTETGDHQSQPLQRRDKRGPAGLNTSRSADGVKVKVKAKVTRVGRAAAEIMTALASDVSRRSVRQILVTL